MKRKSFTLIELLVVIAIIGLLSSIVLVSLSGTRQKAKIAKADADIYEIIKAMEMKKIETDKSLGLITGHWCSSCVCSGACDYSCDACKNRMDIAMRALGFPGALVDPWGRYYSFDENEGEFPSNLCRNDLIYIYEYKTISIPFYSSVCR